MPIHGEHSTICPSANLYNQKGGPEHLSGLLKCRIMLQQTAPSTLLVVMDQFLNNYQLQLKYVSLINKFLNSSLSISAKGFRWWWILQSQTRGRAVSSHLKLSQRGSAAMKNASMSVCQCIYADLCVPVSTAKLCNSVGVKCRIVSMETFAVTQHSQVSSRGRFCNILEVSCESWHIHHIDKTQMRHHLVNVSPFRGLTIHVKQMLQDSYA